MVNFLFLLLSVFSFSKNNLRIGVSGNDYIINDIKKPYTNAEIKKIANIKVTYLEEDVTDKLNYDFSDYEKNKNNIGTFKVVCTIKLEEIEHEYIFKIINKENNSNAKRLDDVFIKTTKDKFLGENDLYNLLETSLNVKIIDPKIVETNYFNEEEEGIFFSLISFKSDNKIFEVMVKIDVVPKEFKEVKLVVGIAALSSATILIILKKIRKKRVL